MARTPRQHRKVMLEVRRKHARPTTSTPGLKDAADRWNEIQKEIVRRQETASSASEANRAADVLNARALAMERRLISGLSGVRVTGEMLGDVGYYVPMAQVDAKKVVEGLKRLGFQIPRAFKHGETWLFDFDGMLGPGRGDI